MSATGVQRDGLAGRVAIVTGGASGIGRAVAQRLCGAGAAVVVADRAATEDAAAAIGGNARAIPVDVRDAAAVGAMTAAALEAFGRIDILVNSAGVTLGRHVLDLSVAEWNDVIAVNLTGTFLCSQACARAMARSGGGRIVNIASVSGMRGVSSRAVYSASKGGVIALTRTMAVELAPHRIAVNAVAPGAIETPLAARHHAGAGAAVRTSYIAATPMRRYGTPEEVAGAVSFLAGADAEYVTGQVLGVDGGFLAAGMIFDLAEEGVEPCPTT
jgi:3-oxoacyl-[acyl-carrier protein] reductase